MDLLSFNQRNFTRILSKKEREREERERPFDCYSVKLSASFASSFSDTTPTYHDGLSDPSTFNVPRFELMSTFLHSGEDGGPKKYSQMKWLDFTRCL